jgi:hypothetical protein
MVKHSNALCGKTWSRGRAHWSDLNTSKLSVKEEKSGWVCWNTPIIPALGRLRQKDHRIQGQPGLHSKTLTLKNERKRREGEGREGKGKGKTKHLPVKTTTSRSCISSRSQV